MNSRKHILVLAGLVGLLCVGAPVRAEHGTDFPAPMRELSSPPPQRPEDAKSTTGPVPPPQAADAALSAPRATAAQVLLTDVPAYIWRDGCGPTAAGMIIGYWDGKGFDNLVSGSGSMQTAAVDDMISSTEHYNDYALPKDSYPANPNPVPDKSELPVGDEHSDNSIADFMDTSQSYRGLYYGWSFYSDMPTALVRWVQMVGPQYTATASNRTLPNFYGGTFTWDVFKAEIDAGRPVVLLVDTNADGVTDHFVAAMGYGDDGVNRTYAARNTWDTGYHWYTFAPMAAGRYWGVYGATLFQIKALPGAFGKVSPSNAAWAQGSNVSISWGDSSDATNYEYCIYTTNKDLCSGSWTLATGTSANLTGLTSGVIYHWQVRANNSAGSTYANGGVWWLWTTAPFPPLFLPLINKS